MENEAITEEAFTVEITQYCDVNKLEIVQESLNMGQIAPGGDKEGNSVFFLSGSSELDNVQAVVSTERATPCWPLLTVSSSVCFVLIKCKLVNDRGDTTE